MVRSKIALRCRSCALMIPFVTGVALANENTLEEVVVTASLRQQPLKDAPVSATVLPATVLQQAGQQHLEDVLALVPNLNWAGGTSRPRYFQIRGIGEREQYEGAPNPSVGFLIDDIDFSGIGMPATLFDVKQIEVLRGPQGMRYGANALAGLITVRGNDPEETPHYSTQATLGDYGTRALGLTATGPVPALDSSWRLALQQYRSDGFMRNAFLNRDDTNNQDELSARFKWRWRPSDTTVLDFTLLHADLNNGYDAWAIDNSRVSLADKPGKDSQRATGASVRLTSTAWSPYTLTVIGSYADSKSVNSYDADWGNAVSWGIYTDDYFSRSDRDRSTGSLEWRFESAPVSSTQRLAWLAGAYALRMHETGRDTLVGQYIDPDDHTYDGSSDDDLANRYVATNVAVFGQLDGYLTQRWRWSSGLRLEQRDARYRDAGVWNGEFRQTDLSARDQMLGGQLSTSYDLARNTTAYASLSRGYKAGGFNLGNIPPEHRYFDPEYLWNLESGVKATVLGGRGYVDVALFYESRKNLQARTGEQLDPTNPGTYTFVTSNFASGYNTGLEGSLRYLIAPSWELGGALGILHTRASGGVDENGNPIAAREQAHAPEYQASVYATWRHASGVIARVDVSAKDKFYFDVPSDNNMQSRAYSVTNLKLGYERPNWNAYLWARNLFDTSYAVRGFYFYNEPPFYEKKLYTQLGDPRQLGLTATWDFQ